MTFWNRKPDEPNAWHKLPVNDSIVEKHDWKIDWALEGGKKRWEINNGS